MPQDGQHSEPLILEPERDDGHRLRRPARRDTEAFQLGGVGQEQSLFPLQRRPDPARTRRQRPERVLGRRSESTPGAEQQVTLAGLDEVDQPGRQSEAFHDAGHGAVQDLLQPERPVDRQRHGVQRLQLPVPTHQLEAHAPDAEKHLDPRDQLVGVERLGDVVVGADLQTHDHVPGGILGGQHDHRDVPPLLVGLQAAAHLVPVHPRHHHVQQDQVDGMLRDAAERLVARMADHRGETTRLEQDLDHARDPDLVLHHQDRGFRTHRSNHCRHAAPPPTLTLDPV